MTHPIILASIHPITARNFILVLFPYKTNLNDGMCLSEIAAEKLTDGRIDRQTEKKERAYKLLRYS